MDKYGRQTKGKPINLKKKIDIVEKYVVSIIGKQNMCRRLTKKLHKVNLFIKHVPQKITLFP